MLGWLLPHKGGKENVLVVRCSCGRAMWLQGAPKKVKAHHFGHHMKVVEHGSLWEFFKMKTGLLNRRTLSECFKDYLQRGTNA